MEEFLQELGITQPGDFTDDGCYVIDIKDSNEYGRIYSKLDKSHLIDEDEDASQVTIENSSIQYVNDEYTITLLADFDSDTYNLVMREN